jgi:hypothetical protein
VFAREIGELYRLERSRNAELDDRIEDLKTAIRRTWLQITTMGPQMTFVTHSKGQLMTDPIASSITP